MLVAIRPVRLCRRAAVSESHGRSAFSLYFTESVRLSTEKVKMAQFLYVRYFKYLWKLGL